MAAIALYSKLDPDAPAAEPTPVLDDAIIVRGDGLVLADLSGGQAVVDDALAGELVAMRGDLSLTPDTF